MKKNSFYAVLFLVISILIVFSCKVKGNKNSDGSPEINIQFLAADVAVETTNLNVGQVLPDIPSTLVFTVQNTGDADLDLSGSPAVSLSGDSVFSLATDAAASIAASEETTFEIIFLSSTPGLFSADISIANSDDDENPYIFTIQGECLDTSAPEMNIRFLGSDVSSGTTDLGVGTLEPGDSSTLVFTVQNTGNADLVITGSTDLVGINGDAEFTLETDLSSGTISSLGSDAFEIQFSPAAEGTFTTEITINNNDSDENPYTIIILGECVDTLEPEMNVRFNSADIADGSTGTDVGTLEPGDSSTLVFTVQNTGNADLVITGSTDLVGINGDAEFTLETDLSSGTISSLGSDAFEIQFSPAAEGTFTTEITISNNDSDEDPYNFTIQGQCVDTTLPEMNITFDGSDVADGSTGLDVGSVLIGSSITIDFTIENTGTDSLEISGSPLVGLISGSEFTLNQDLPAATIAALYDDSFQLLFSPASAGDYTGTISIVNNDNDENPYNFTFTATGLDEPEMDVFYGAEEIADGTSDYVLGSIVTGSTTDFTFTIQNNGTQPLSLIYVPAVVISGSGFSITTDAPWPVAASGGTSDFIAQFTQTVCGTYTGDISIDNDDADENPYEFTVTVDVVPNAPAIALDATVDSGSSASDGNNRSFYQRNS